jgi:hypothetical protein
MIEAFIAEQRTFCSAIQAFNPGGKTSKPAIKTFNAND